MARQFRVSLLGWALLACTAHGNQEAASERTGVDAETDHFAWLAEVEPPSLDRDLALEFAARPIECMPAQPWLGEREWYPLQSEFVDQMVLIYGDRPGVAGFQTAVGLPLAALPEFEAAGLQPQVLSWSAGEQRGFEQIYRTTDREPTRLDGFDSQGNWRRSALFQHRDRLTRRVEFQVVDGQPIRGRTLVFEGEQIIAILAEDHVEYRRWRTDRGPQRVIFEHHPDRLIRTAQIYEDGEPYERVDVLAPLDDSTR
jgi:hypothetical protein